MSENEMLDRCLAALKKCQSEEEVKETLENCELTDEELDRICGGTIVLGCRCGRISGGSGFDSLFIQ